MTMSERLAATLVEILIDSATDEQVKDIAVTMHEFRSTHKRAYLNVIKQPFALHIIQALEEGVQYRGEEVK